MITGISKMSNAAFTWNVDRVKLLRNTSSLRIIPIPPSMITTINTTHNNAASAHVFTIHDFARVFTFQDLVRLTDTNSRSQNHIIEYRDHAVLGSVQLLFEITHSILTIPSPTLTPLRSTFVVLRHSNVKLYRSNVHLFLLRVEILRNRNAWSLFFPSASFVAAPLQKDGLARAPDIVLRFSLGGKEKTGEGGGEEMGRIRKAKIDRRTLAIVPRTKKNEPRVMPSTNCNAENIYKRNCRELCLGGRPRSLWSCPATRNLRATERAERSLDWPSSRLVYPHHRHFQTGGDSPQFRWEIRAAMDPGRDM